jgi:hypothetical protein
MSATLRSDQKIAIECSRYNSILNGRILRSIGRTNGDVAALSTPTILTIVVAYGFVIYPFVMATFRQWFAKYGY